MKKIFLLLMGMGLFVIGCEMESDSGNISYPGGVMDKIILHSPEEYKYIYYQLDGQDNSFGMYMTIEESGWYQCSIEASSATVQFLVAPGNWTGASSILRVTCGEWWYDSSTGALCDTQPALGDDIEENEDSSLLASPERVTATYISEHDEIKVTWSPVDGATSYEFWWGKTANVNNAKQGENRTSVTASLTNVSAGTTYYFWIKAKNNSVTSNFSDYGSCTVPRKEILPAPTGVSADVTSSTSVRLSWNRVSGAVKYYVYLNTIPYTDTAKYLGVVSNSTYYDIISGLSENKTYYIWVKAYDGNVFSEYSSYAKITLSASWTPPRDFQEITGLGAENAIVKNVIAGNTYWFRILATQPSNNQYKYTICFFDRQSSTDFTSDVVGTFYNQTGIIYAENIDNGTWGESASYYTSQYLYVKIDCKISGSFGIYCVRERL